jgi:hypothetical protein
MAAGLIILGIVAIFVFGYLVGANNPLASVKQKIKDSVNKI